MFKQLFNHLHKESVFEAAVTDDTSPAMRPSAICPCRFILHQPDKAVPAFWDILDYLPNL